MKIKKKEFQLYKMIKFYILLNDEIKKKNQFSRRTKKMKRMRIKIGINNKNKILIEE
jgi:DNA-binding CsgD family transcriptional regulator